MPVATAISLVFIGSEEFFRVSIIFSADSIMFSVWFVLQKYKYFEQSHNYLLTLKQNELSEIH